MELFEEIRRGYAAGETIKGLAKKHGVHRRMVRQAIAQCDSARAKEAPTEAAEDRSVEGSDRADAGEPIGRRRGSSGTQRTGSGRDCVRSIPSTRSPRPQCGNTCGDGNWSWAGGREVFVPQSYEWGQEAQVDWFEAVAKLDGRAAASCSSSRCAAWRRETHFIGRTRTPRSKRS